MSPISSTARACRSGWNAGGALCRRALGFVLERTIVRRFYAAPIVAMLGTYALGLIIREIVRGLIGGLFCRSGAARRLGQYRHHALLHLAAGDHSHYGAGDDRQLPAAGAHRVRVAHSGVAGKSALARASGISTNAIYGATFAFGAAFAGLAGALIVPVFSLFADLGLRFLIQGFVAVMVGGVGLFAGRWRAPADRTLAAALPWIIPPVIADVLVFVLAIIFIKFRPQGLISARGLVPCSTTAAISAAGDFSPISPLPAPRSPRASAAGSSVPTGRTRGGPDQGRRRDRSDRSDRLCRQCERQCRQDGGQGNQRRRRAAWPAAGTVHRGHRVERTGRGKPRKLIQRDKVDLVLGGITSSMRNAIKDVIVARGKTLYIYPQLYEGKECTPYLFCTGPTPAQATNSFPG